MAEEAALAATSAAPAAPATSEAVSAPVTTESPAASDAPVDGAADTAESAKVDGDVVNADDKTDTSKPAGAPEKYEFKAPEGQSFDANVLAQFEEVAREINLPQAEAQKMLDKIAPALAQKQADIIKAAQDEWVASTKADKEIGGDKLDANLSVAKKALDTFGTPALRDLLNESGLGNHPEIIRAFYKAGKAISEDSFVPGGSKPAGNSDQSLASKLYG
jgi:hypothetical protein